ncbi:MAG: hypothetical protein ABI670_12265 [Chloroflexota bacterium]
MTIPTDPEAEFNIIADNLATRADTVRKKVFGLPNIAVNGKAFAAFQNGDMAFKLAGDAHAQALEITDSSLWDPSGQGRPMKEWVRVPASESAHWPTFAEHAYTYVAEVSSR